MYQDKSLNASPLLSIGRFVERSLLTNDNEGGFSSIVQVSGGWKPTIPQLIPIMRNIDLTARTRRMAFEDLGWHVKLSSKSKYTYHSVESDPTLTWNDGSGEGVDSAGQRRYQSNVLKRTVNISKGSQLMIRGYHVVPIERGRVNV